MIRLKSEETIERLKQYVNSTIERIENDERFCYSIPLSNRKNSSTYQAQVSLSYHAEKAKVSYNVLTMKYIHLIEPLNEALIECGIILPNVNVFMLARRSKALFWWFGLTKEEKIKLDTFGNCLQIHKYVAGWNTGSSKSQKEIEVQQKLEDKFNKELVELGVLKTDYVKVKDRAALRDKNFHKNLVKSSEYWEYLSELPLEKEAHLLVPSEESVSFIQVRQLFAAQTRSISSVSGKSNYRDAFMHFSQFLIAENIPDNTLLKDILNEFFLTRFKQDYLLPKMNQGDISPSTAPTILSGVRRTLNRATRIKGLGFNSFYDVMFDAKGRVTDTYKPYSKAERMAIHNSIQFDIAQTKGLMKPYKRSGLGENPLDAQGKRISGKGTPDNARYLFENELDCQPVFYGTPNKSMAQEIFIRIVNILDIGLHDLYRSWGVLSIVDKSVIAPFVYRLSQITGMNAESVMPLNLDDLILEHHTTGRPCLRYWKERSTGAKELHLDLFQAKLQWLTVKQSKEVVDIFDTVKFLTASLRSEAPIEITNKLFIYQNTGKNQVSSSTIMDFELGTSRLSATYPRFVTKHGLKNDKGAPLKFTMTRFRPSFVSDLIEEGVSIREIQVMLGHKNITTTMNYLDRLDFNRVARTKVKEALERIHEKVVNPHEDGKHSGQQYQDNPERIIFTTPLGGCTNIFNPPEFIRQSKSYVEGQSCSQYNKCLSCDNVMLTSTHLPELFAMRRDYQILMQRNRIMDTPYGVVINENLVLLDEILAPDKSAFTTEELDKAERLSRFVEVAVIDGVGV
jgi:hypothetical protein